jgi:RAB protein geranylgeranyltransferase component A
MGGKGKWGYVYSLILCPDGSLRFSVNTQPFRNASLWKTDAESSKEPAKLSFSRAYTLTLSPQIIYTKSKLLAQLVSSKVYRQLEFQAVGNWWLCDTPTNTDAAVAVLKRLPNGREDIFQDHGIDNRAKRSLMRFLKFVVDYENQTDIWEPHAESGMTEFLSSQFQLPPHLQTVIISLTLSLDPPQQTLVKYALSRIATHLTSIGVFGPGFGAVLPKWGGGAEIAQVACRAGAVGGAVYVLGASIKESKIINGQGDQSLTEIALSNSETVRTRHLTTGTDSDDQASSKSRAVSKIVAVVSSPLTSLFVSSIEGAPLAAVSVVVFPPSAISVDGLSQANPIYVIAHSSETGECPGGQCQCYPFPSFPFNGPFKALHDDSTFEYLSTLSDFT